MSMFKCFGIIITSLIALCILLIPVNGQAAFLSMPVVGDGSIVLFNEEMLLSFTSLVGLGEELFDDFSIIIDADADCVTSFAEISSITDTTITRMTQQSGTTGGHKTA